MRLLADCMLGRLAKWLRMLGYDCAYESDATDHELARQARAEGRLLLTCDRELAGRRGLKTLLIRSQGLDQQVREVQRALGPPPGLPLTRCPVCNVLLEDISGHDVVLRVPAYVRETRAEFRQCAVCRRVYWPGSHVEAMGEKMGDFDP